MSFIDLIRELLGNNKKNARFITENLCKIYGEKDQLEVALYEENTPLVGKIVKININGRDYERKTDESGIARLNINLGPGEYTPLISFSDNEYNIVTAFTKVTVQSKTRMEGTNVNKTFGDSTQYQCAVYDELNNRVSGIVELTINGRTYARTPDASGLYKLNINLNPGTYDLAAKYLGDTLHLPSSVMNTVVVNEPPKPEPKHELYDYITEQGGGKLGQRTGYTCGPHSLMQCIYRLTGIELSEMELASVCGTTTSGTDHDGLATGLAWFNRKYGYNLKMVWKNFSEVGFSGLQKFKDEGAVFCHLLYRNEWGHYEVPLTSNSNPMRILNSLGDSCGNGYCGYIESRSQGTQQSYINGISQKSVCIIMR